jgi:hypothetical protein
MVAAPAFRLEGADHERVGQLVMAAADAVMKDGS